MRPVNPPLSVLDRAILRFVADTLEIPMPYKSKAQSRLVHAAAHNPEIAKKTGFKQSAAKKFEKDSAGQKLGKLPEHVKKGK